MREILFRAKETFNGEWVEGYYEFGYDAETEKPAHYMWVVNHSEKYGEIFMVIPETVGQYTGLTDKNGKKIFEGDILKVKHGILGIEEEKPKMPRNAYGLHYKENEIGMFGRWFYYRNYAVEYKVHGNSKGKYIVRNGSDQCDFTHSLFYNHDAEIIGNIHDNPELLKEVTQ